VALFSQTVMGQRWPRSCFQSARPHAGCRKQHCGRAPSKTIAPLAMLSWHLRLSCLRWGAHSSQISHCSGPPHMSPVKMMATGLKPLSAATLLTSTSKANMSQKRF
jgi:hypothetical protein